ncbi:hypothetical protein EII29_10965, partial [Leptotrichia sp. OH3620_COT-345]
MIDEVVKENIDIDRIYVFGVSVGGYMSIRTAIEYPNFFAGINVNAPAINIASRRGGVKTTIEDIQKIKNIPFWIVHSENDPIVDYKTSSKWLYKILIKGKNGKNSKQRHSKNGGYKDNGEKKEKK